MKVLAFEQEPSSSRGGQEHSMADECTGLTARGHSVSLGYVVPGDLLPRYAAAGVRTIPLTAITIEAADRLRGGGAWLASVARAARLPADVVVVNQYHDVLFGSAVARVRRLPLVCHLRLMPPHEFCGQWRLGLSGVTRFIAVSDAVRREWIARGVNPQVVDVVHDGIDVERFRPYDNRAAKRRELGVPEGAFVVAFAGRIDRQKRIDGLLDAFARLDLPASEARLLIAGRPVELDAAAGARYVEELKAHARALGIADSVHWLGPRSDVAELLSAADMSALFTRNPEALARTTYESMACGTPPIAQRDGGMAEVLSGEFARFAFDGADIEQPVALMRELRDWRRRDPALGDRLRAHAVRYFSRESMVAGIEASLERALAARPLRRGPSLRELRTAG